MTRAATPRTDIGLATQLTKATKDEPPGPGTGITYPVDARPAFKFSSRMTTYLHHLRNLRFLRAARLLLLRFVPFVFRNCVGRTTWLYVGSWDDRLV
jgi:hypothetical protein